MPIQRPFEFLADARDVVRERLGISSFMVGGLGPLDPLVERLAGR